MITLSYLFTLQPWRSFISSVVIPFSSRCREKQRKEAVNRKLNAMNKLLMEENDRLQKQVSHLVYENGHMKQHVHIRIGETRIKEGRGGACYRDYT
ncbi:hypothetical protein ISN44_As10g018390 [Arabidopsis suecica]|uniref:Uncharacterized protein n=1 Tax=Arabidopsis suecica TaxID=45249 RepID=A0A8T1ZYR2_ARASU|nr:hypothetical protein ISN44_Un31g000020 [Arabidopsis suecica]KAG7531480.1 hypothetical protein ISN44_Un31g000050 [Arabidopsis suecica]KAG7565120.1 hypothetical protein ISN44_As10g018390 [Arabidopsis suecica]